jgi:hypothetical protein
MLDRVLVAARAPDPGAPPCMRQRFFPSTAGDLHGLPERVLAPQRGLRSIGPVLRDDRRSFIWFRSVGTLMEAYDRDAL